MEEGEGSRADTAAGEQAAPVAEPPVAGPEVQKQSHKALWGIIIVLLAAIIAVCAYGVWHARHTSKLAVVTQKSVAPKPVTAPAKLPGLQLDPNKNYGNRYANGLLPVGDNNYVTTGAKKGYIYACSQYVQSLGKGEGGAGTRGPWFTNGNTEYDINKKAHVLGSVTWQAEFTDTLSGTTRTIVTNDLPSHVTGVFPIASSDPAYQYDRNPNAIKGQSLTFALAANPAYNATPNCMGGTVGVMLTGVVLNNAFDAGGRDAGAWEVQDSCSGHPQDKGEYHYHTLSSCIKDISVHTVIGYALDGFPITGPQVGTDNMLTTSDLDECHGITGPYFVAGKSVTGYHYVMTQDFPYSVSCFRAPAINPPGMQSGGQPPR